MENTVDGNESKTPREFAVAYGELCKEYGYRVVVTPNYIMTNHGTFELTLTYSVGTLPVEGQI